MPEKAGRYTLRSPGASIGSSCKQSFPLVANRGLEAVFSAWPVWIGRVGDAGPKADSSNLTPSKRIEFCWQVTKQA
jgi:hypothetical protein